MDVWKESTYVIGLQTKPAAFFMEYHFYMKEYLQALVVIQTRQLPKSEQSEPATSWKQLIIFTAYDKIPAFK